jgi:hypothetical protein
MNFGKKESRSIYGNLPPIYGLQKLVGGGGCGVDGLPIFIQTIFLIKFVKRKMIFGSIHVTIFHLETSCLFCTY